MAGNSFGKLFKVTTFGESHGVAIGGVIDGCPAGVTVDFDAIQAEDGIRDVAPSRGLEMCIRDRAFRLQLQMVAETKSETGL